MNMALEWIKMQNKPFPILDSPAVSITQQQRISLEIVSSVDMGLRKIVSKHLNAIWKQQQRTTQMLM